jgi:hypothetical protein
MEHKLLTPEMLSSPEVADRAREKLQELRDKGLKAVLPDEFLSSLAEKQDLLNEDNELSRITGIGDILARITAGLGIPPCGGCKERQEALNKLLPLG